MLITSTLQANKYKEQLFIQQNGICPLCHNALGLINESHLDHSHDLTGLNAGKCRSLLHAQCNLLEGTIRHKFSRAGLKSKVDYVLFLKNLASYLEQDYSGKLYHPKFITDLVKTYTRLSRKEQKLIIEEFGETPTNRADDIKLYRKLIKHFYSNEVNHETQ